MASHFKRRVTGDQTSDSKELCLINNIKMLEQSFVCYFLTERIVSAIELHTESGAGTSPNNQTVCIGPLPVPLSPSQCGVTICGEMPEIRIG